MGFKHKRPLFLGVLLIIFTLIFWTQSRYPQLNEKEQMSGRLKINEALSFDVVYPIHDKDPLFKKIAYSFINWCATNKNGMIFGVLFATLFLTLLQNVPKRPKTKNRFIHSLVGMLLGAPLGVCANCVAPIGQGMYKTGEKPETILATIHSSPSLNIIVLTMLFSLFPLDFAIIKVFFSVFFILVVTPILTKTFSKDIKVPEEFCPIEIVPKENWGTAIKESFKGFFKNLQYILWETVPIMFLAGILGLAVVEIFDLSFLQSPKESLPLYFLIALIGTFLPVPIAFDLVFSFVLLKSGLGIGPALTFNFCLGIFSIYPFFIIYQTLSKKLAFGVFVSTMVVGILAGYTVSLKHLYTERRDLALIDEHLKKLEKKAQKKGSLQGDKFYGIVLKACSLYKEKGERDECIEETIFKEAKSKMNYHYCLVGKKRPREKKDQCLKNLFPSYVIQGKFDPGFCQSNNAKEKKACQKKLTIYSRVSLSKDFSLCKKLEGEEVKICKSLMSDYFLSKGGDIEFCLKKENIRKCLEANKRPQSLAVKGHFGFKRCTLYPTEEGKERCIEELYFFVTYPPVSLGCEKVKDPQLKSKCLKLKEYADVAKKGGPFSYCEENFKKEHIRDFCEKAMLEKMFIDGGKDIYKKCNQFKKPSRCLKAASLFIHEREGIKSKESICSKVIDPKIKDSCLEEVAYKEMSYYEMLQTCSGEEAQGYIPQRQCERMAKDGFKRNKIKEEVCTFFKEKEQQKNCYKKIIFMYALLGKVEKCSLLKGADFKECQKVYKDHKIQMGLRGGISTLFVETHSKKLEGKEKKDIFKGEKVKKAKNIQLSPFYESKNVKILSFPHFNRSTGSMLPTVFQKIEGPEIGLNYSYGFSVLENFEPFKYGKGIASGDFNNDLWPDIAVATETGVQLYQNLGNGRFQRIPFNPKTKGIPFMTTLVDINNDGWQDLYISSYGGLSHFYLNQKGVFEEVGLDLSDPKNVILTMSGAFSDIDRDGDIDFVQGNWSYGAYNFRRLKTETSVNRIFINTGVKKEFFKRTAFNDSLKGETLSILLTDINQDGKVDLFTGNDFSIPDGFYLGKEKGQFQKIKKSDKIIPLISQYTMSLDSADINNDLHLDLFSAEMAFVGKEKDETYCNNIKNKKAKVQCQKHFSIRDLSRKRDIEKCSEYKGETYKNCLFSMMIGMMTDSKDIKNCQKIPKSLKEARLFCQKLFDLKKIEDQTVTDRNFDQEDLPQRPMSNLLLVSDGKGAFIDKTKKFGVINSFWSWNAKFADVDNDEWQDLYVGNGFLLNDEMSTNVFFHNQKGQSFLQKEKEFGLEDFIHTHSYTYIDYDLDGDLDILATGNYAPLRLFKNHSKKGHSLSFSFVDHKGNRNGIGNKVIIHYGNQGESRQIREVKMGGGFLSFDRPWVHFGLGGNKKVTKVEVIWSTGEKTTLKKDFRVGKHYQIERKEGNL